MLPPVEALEAEVQEDTLSSGSATPVKSLLETRRPTTVDEHDTGEGWRGCKPHQESMDCNFDAGGETYISASTATE